MTTSSQASHPRIYSDPTLRIAVLCLVAIAVAQAIAALIALAPALRISDFTEARELPVAATQERVAQALMESSPAQEEASVFVEASVEVIERANLMLEQADTLRAQGDLEGAFAALSEADHLVPQEPGILYQMSIVAFEMGRLTDSRELASRAISIPSLRSDPNYAQVYQQLTLLLSELGAPSPGLSSTGEPLNDATQPGAATQASPAARPQAIGTSPGASMLRDDAGIPIGSTFGIVEARISDGEQGVKNLRVATKAAPGEEPVDAAEFKVVVYFYEQRDDGSIVETDANVMSEWMSPPINWQGEPELLELRYPLPSEDNGDMGDLQYHGYVIGIYFKGELQDSRAEPVTLLEQFPLALTASQSEE